MATSFDLVKAAILVHGDDLASYPHVLKVEPGFAFADGQITDEPAVLVTVDRKLYLPTYGGRMTRSRCDAGFC